MFVRKMLITVAAATLATPAIAQTPDEGNSTFVHVGDLDLTRNGDRDRMNNRIENAARRVCRSAMRGIAAAMAEESCIKVALAGARPQAERAIALASKTTRIAALEISHAE